MKLEKIEWVEDAKPQDLVELREMLNHPDIRRALSKSSYADNAEIEVLRELPFILRQDDGSLLTGQLDRLVLMKQGVKIVKAQIIDFKTDQLPPNDPAALQARVEQYRPQIEAYRSAVSRLYGIESAVITARLLFVSAGVAIDILCPVA